MPRVSKKRKAAKQRWLKKRAAQLAVQVPSIPSTGQSIQSGLWLSSHQEHPEVLVQGEDIKQEPLEIETSPFELDHLEEIKLEVELLDPEEEEEPDPIGGFQQLAETANSPRNEDLEEPDLVVEQQQVSTKVKNQPKKNADFVKKQQVSTKVKNQPKKKADFVKKQQVSTKVKNQPKKNADFVKKQQVSTKVKNQPKKNEDHHWPSDLTADQIRCRFCFQPFRADGGDQGIITREMIDYVLGVHTLGSHREGPNCCKECKMMFKLFYDFKKSCLAALINPDWVLGSAEKKTLNKVVEVTSIRKEQVKHPGISQQVMPQAGRELVKDDGNSNSEAKKTCTEIRSEVVESNKNTGEPKLECQICGAKFFETSVLQQHCQTHSTTAMTVKIVSVPQSLSENSDIEVVRDDDSAGNGSTLRQILSIEQPSHKIDILPLEPKPMTEELTNLQQNQNDLKYYCSRCQKYFVTEIIFTHHKPFCIKARKTVKRSIACDQCPKRFRSEKELEYHLNRHKGLRTIPCRGEGCTKMFFSLKNRATHESACDLNKQLICYICAAVLTSRRILDNHILKHGEATVSCEHCDKTFHTKAQLKKHSTAHSDARNHECKVCGKRFKSHYANRVHQRIHTQEKPYVCHVCGMAFTYNCSLKTHLEKAHELAGPRIIGTE